MKYLKPNKLRNILLTYICLGVVLTYLFIFSMPSPGYDQLGPEFILFPLSIPILWSVFSILGEKLSLFSVVIITFVAILYTVHIDNLVRYMRDKKNISILVSFIILYVCAIILSFFTFAMIGIPVSLGIIALMFILSVKDILRKNI